MNEKEILKHEALIHKVIKDMHCQYRNEQEYQEYYDAGIMGLVKGAKTYDGTTKPATYLYTCIKNEIAKVFTYRTRYKRLGITESLNKLIKEDDDKSGELQETIPSDENIEEDFIKKVQYENLYKAINQIKPRRREVLKRNYGIGSPKTPIRKLAKEYGVSRSTIAYDLCNARRDLKKILMEQQKDYYQKEKETKEKNKRLEDLLMEELS